jgi:osmotically-inducible protein OsmY
MHRFHPLLLLLLLLALLGACNPYMAAVSVVSQTYEVATDARSAATQASDTETEASVKASLVASPVPGTGSLTVWVRQGVVVLAGVVPLGSPAGRAAVEIARDTPGVARVETFFVASRPSEASDLEIEAKIKAAFVADPNVMQERASVGVYDGHVVLIGVVQSRDRIDDYLTDAQSVAGVRSVRSYIQVVD